MEKEYSGAIVEESLTDNRIINKFRVLRFKITLDENPKERWHIYYVKVTKRDIGELSKMLKPEKWYAHFWNGNEVIAVFSNKTFVFRHDDKDTWKDAIDYGLSVGIPRKQLDFIISE